MPAHGRPADPGRNTRQLLGQPCAALLHSPAPSPSMNAWGYDPDRMRGPTAAAVWGCVAIWARMCARVQRTIMQRGRATRHRLHSRPIDGGPSTRAPTPRPGSATLVEVLDEDDLVARLVVDQLIDDPSRDREPQTPWPQSLLLSHQSVPQRIVLRIVDRRVHEAVGAEPRTGIGDAVQQHAARAQAGDANHPDRIDRPRGQGCH